MPEIPANRPKRGRPPKKASDLTSEEVLKKLFPKKAVEKAKEEAGTTEKPDNEAI
jgi:hypothetical protein